MFSSFFSKQAYKYFPITYYKSPLSQKRPDERARLCTMEFMLYEHRRATTWNKQNKETQVAQSLGNKRKKEKRKEAPTLTKTPCPVC